MTRAVRRRLRSLLYSIVAVASVIWPIVGATQSSGDERTQDAGGGAAEPDAGATSGPEGTDAADAGRAGDTGVSAAKDRPETADRVEKTGSEGGDEAEKVEPAADVVAYCKRYRAQHGQSSARKLYRALISRNYNLTSVGLPGRTTVEVVEEGGDSERVRFDVYDENEGRSAALVPVQRDYPSTYVVAMTKSGPLITKQQWPAPESLQSKSDCSPNRSWVVYPEVSADEIDVKPFDYWGIRVLWRIPSSFKESSPDWATMKTALRKVLGET